MRFDLNMLKKLLSAVVLARALEFATVVWSARLWRRSAAFKISGHRQLPRPALNFSSGESVPNAQNPLNFRSEDPGINQSCGSGGCASKTA